MLGLTQLSKDYLAGKAARSVRMVVFWTKNPFLSIETAKKMDRLKHICKEIMVEEMWHQEVKVVWAGARGKVLDRERMDKPKYIFCKETKGKETWHQEVMLVLEGVRGRVLDTEVNINTVIEWGRMEHTVTEMLMELEDR